MTSHPTSTTKKEGETWTIETFHVIFLITPLRLGRAYSSEDGTKQLLSFVTTQGQCAS